MHSIALTPFSKLKKETILIGANCISKENKRQVEFFGNIVIDPYKDNSEIAECSNLCWELALSCCEDLGRRLNKVYNFTYSPAYWKTVFLPWTVAFVENLYDRYLRLRWLEQHYPCSIIEIPKIDDSMPYYKKSFDVWRKAHLHIPNIKLYSYLIQSLGLDKNVKYLDIEIDELRSVNIDSGYADKIVSYLYRAINLHAGKNVIFWNMSKPETIFNLSRKLGWLQWGVPYLKENGFVNSPFDRAQIILETDSGSFKEILYKIIWKVLPVSLVEQFTQRRNVALAFLNKKNINSIIISQYFWIYDTQKILLAEAKERGSKIFGFQHGGGYGQQSIVATERVERQICDYFITWGWDDNGSCPTLPLPVPHLSELAGTHIKEKNDILYIGSHAPMYMFRYMDYWNPEYVCLKYYMLKERFLKNLSESVKKNILYRPYPIEYGWNEKERISEIVPSVRFFLGGHLTDIMARSSIVVIDHPGTSFLEALTINVPTIIFWDKYHCCMREETRSYFKLLSDSGILFYDPVEAAKKVNQIAGVPEEWWNRQDVQLARKKFCSRYAWADQNWQEIWKKNIQPLL